MGELKLEPLCPDRHPPAQTHADSYTSVRIRKIILMLAIRWATQATVGFERKSRNTMMI